MTKKTWCIQKSWSGIDDFKVFLEPPFPNLEHLIGKSEQIVFFRNFTDVPSFTSPIEISQKLIHSLDLYFLEEKKGYCRLDNEGEIERVIFIHNPPDEDPNPISCVSIVKKDLETYMALSSMVMVIRFCFIRSGKNFSDWDHSKKKRIRR